MRLLFILIAHLLVALARLTVPAGFGRSRLNRWPSAKERIRG